MKYKRNLIIILIAVIIYVTLTLIYNKIFVNSNEKNIFVVREDMLRGCEINIGNLQSLTIKEGDVTSDYITDISILNDKVLNFDICEGQILTNEMLIQKDNYIKSNEDEELVSIKVKSSEDSSSYKISKNSVVNIYYTGKSDYANEILKELDNTNIVSGGNPGYITTEFIKNIKVINVYDKYGNELNSNIQNDNESLIDTIVISVSSKIAMDIYNLSRYGDFSISVLN